MPHRPYVPRLRAVVICFGESGVTDCFPGPASPHFACDLAEEALLLRLDVHAAAQGNHVNRVRGKALNRGGCSSGHRQKRRPPWEVVQGGQVKQQRGDNLNTTEVLLCKDKIISFCEFYAGSFSLPGLFTYQLTPKVTHLS